MPDTRGPMARAVATALGAATVDERDEGVAELARRYARLIDAAAPAAKYSKLIERVELVLHLASLDDAGTVEVIDEWDKIKQALAAHSVASDLGPKLQAALTALGLSVAGRGAVRGGATDDKPVSAPVDAVAVRRAERAARAGLDGA